MKPPKLFPSIAAEAFGWAQQVVELEPATAIEEGPACMASRRGGGGVLRGGAFLEPPEEAKLFVGKPAL